MQCAVNSAEQPYYGATLSMARQSTRSRSVLDVGCGRNPYFFHSRFKNYVGIDINVATLKEASGNLPEANLIRASGSHAPFKDGIFDLVICTEVLEHLKSPEKMVAEINRVLTAAGTAVISIPSLSLPQTIILWIAYNTGKIAEKPYQSPDHVREYARIRVAPHFEKVSDFFSLLRREGFEVEDVAAVQSLYTSPKLLYKGVLAKIEKPLERVFSKNLFGHHLVLKAQKRVHP
jgi:ubiquinone/menaquinone biosynthesis C-methylase UbiE